MNEVRLQFKIELLWKVPFLFFFFNTLHTVHCILYTVLTLYTANCTRYVHSTLHTVHCTCTVHCILYICILLLQFIRTFWSPVFDLYIVYLVYYYIYSISSILLYIEKYNSILSGNFLALSRENNMSSHNFSKNDMKLFFLSSRSDILFYVFKGVFEISFYGIKNSLQPKTVE